MGLGALAACGEETSSSDGGEPGSGADVDNFGGATSGDQNVGSTGGATSGTDPSCREGETRESDLVCGLQGSGREEQICQDGAWEDGSNCLGAAQCTEGDIRNTTDACGADGVLLESCLAGKWISTDQCNETPECGTGAEQVGSFPCGLNGRGFLKETCVGGFWISQEDECQDPDSCVDESLRTASPVQACGLNDRGTLMESCEVGKWLAFCDDPDECEDGAKSEQACEGALSAPALCESGAWTAGACDYRMPYLIPGSLEVREVDMTADGRIIVFSSSAALVPEDKDQVGDLFIHDLETGVTTRLELTPDGAPANGDSSQPRISGDGRYITFVSDATNLGWEDTNGQRDAFRYDRETGEILIVQVPAGSGMTPPYASVPTISNDGSRIAFRANGTVGVFPRDDPYVYDFGSTDFTRLWYGREDAGEPVISGNGSFVAFSTIDRLYSDYALRVDDLDGDGSESWVGGLYDPQLSDDGSRLCFHTGLGVSLVPGDTNGKSDIYIRNLGSGSYSRVSVSSSGAQGDWGSSSCRITGDGRYVGFSSFATTLVENDHNASSDAFLHDTQMQTTVRLSVNADGIEGNDSSNLRALSDDGKFALLRTSATNLTPEGKRGLVVIPLP